MDGEQYLTPEQVADLVQVTRRTVYNWIKTGKLKAYKVGNMVRVRHKDLDAFITPVVPGGGQL